jgi:hypothetical protein
MTSGTIATASAIALAVTAFTAPPASAAIQHSRLADGTEGIYVTGEILEPDQAAFEELAQRYRKAVVFLECPGGSLDAAIAIGKQVRSKGYATAVLDEGTCNSACALIWLAGTPRYLADAGHLGFHASYFEEGGRLVETGVGNAIVGHYLSQLGLTEKAVIFATSASPYEINTLTAANSGEAEIAFESSLAALPEPYRELLVDTSLLQKAKVALASAPPPGKPASQSDPDKARPAEAPAEPEELTKARPSPGKTR